MLKRIALLCAIHLALAVGPRNAWRAILRRAVSDLEISQLLEFECKQIFGCDKPYVQPHLRLHFYVLHIDCVLVT